MSFSAFESAEHLHLRHTIIALRNDLIHRDLQLIGPAGLSPSPIRVCPLILDGEDTFKPRFFTPFDTDPLPDPEPIYVGIELDPEAFARQQPTSENWNCLILRYTERYFLQLLKEDPLLEMEAWEPTENSNPGVRQFAESNWHFVPTDARFGPYWIFRHRRSGSQIKCLMYNNRYEAQENISHEEISMIFNLMLRQLHDETLNGHMVFPVLIISVSGPRIRVIEAFYNGAQMIVRKSRLFGLLGQVHDTFLLIARWYLGSAAGDTSMGGFKALQGLVLE